MEQCWALAQCTEFKHYSEQAHRVMLGHGAWMSCVAACTSSGWQVLAEHSTEPSNHNQQAKSLQISSCLVSGLEK
eukprot:scaffold36811_cov17-Tisochrysis_lutea.AAC.4